MSPGRGSTWLIALAAGLAGCVDLSPPRGVSSLKAGDAAPDARADGGRTPLGGSADARMDVAPASGRPTLHWRFDDVGFLRAADSSGSRLDGLYIGELTGPGASPLVPRVQFANPLSRSFTRADEQYVRLPIMPQALRSPEVSISAWYRATSIDTEDPISRPGSELVNAGTNAYVLRLLDGQIELLKRVVAPTGVVYVRCYAPVTNALDGGWHHVAGVAGAGGMKVYFDGVERCSNTSGEPIAYAYDLTPLIVGRYADPEGGYYFEGNIDDLRVFTRPLSPTEVAELARGEP
jgi:Concanavalin A-like lectin/glucanases superfamily